MPQQMDFFLKMIGRPVSRVLSFKTIIYLKHASLHIFSHLFGRCRANLASTIRCCSEWGLQHRSVAILWVSSYLTFPPSPRMPWGIQKARFFTRSRTRVRQRGKTRLNKRIKMEFEPLREFLPQLFFVQKK